MNWWNVLEISQHSDLKTIKRAYAKLLKIYSPEEDAEGYQRLREAYDEAVKYAKRNNKNNELISKVEINKNECSTFENYSSEDELNKLKADSFVNHINYEKNDIENENNFKLNLDINEIYYEEQDTGLNLNEQINQFLNRLNEIYNDMSLRTDLSTWEDLLNSDMVWNVDAFPIIEDELFNFLSDHKYLPAEIWTKLNNNFTWSENEIKLYDQYYAPLVDEFLKNLKEPSNLKYDFIKSINIEIADEYLYERQLADKALKYRKFAIAYNHLKKANSLFSQDAELLRLMGDYDYEFNHVEEALEFYKAAFEINNNDLNSALHIGVILASKERFGEAIPYLEVYLSYYNKDKLALKYIAYCYYYNDDLIMSKENFRRLLIFDEKNRITKKYLKNIEAQLKGKYVRKIKFDKDELMKLTAKKEIETEKTSIREGRSNKEFIYIIKYLTRAIVIFIILFVIRHPWGDKDHSKTYENTHKVNKINTMEQIFNSNTGNMAMHLSNVKPIKYYKISEPFENKIIFSDSELDEKGLRGKVESQLYIGISKENLIIFADSKFSDRTISENGSYFISGAICHIDKDIGDKIKEEYASDYQGIYLIVNGFIDAY